jgi:glycosyltransferase involved in cell wall biosynthesis
MRFAFISGMNGSPWGGSEELWSQSALHLVREGHTVLASVPFWNDQPKQITELISSNVSVTRRRTTVLRKMVSKGKELFGADRIRIEEDNLAQWLLSANADLFCISNGEIGDGLPWMLACRRLKLPYIVVAHANSEQFWPDDESRAQLESAYTSSLVSFFVSRRNQELLEIQLGIRLPNCQIVRNPFNVSYDANPPWPDDCDQWRFGCVARLEPAAKGQDLLMQIFARRKWRDRPITVSIYGSGPSQQGLEKLRDLYNVDRVHLAGFDPNVEHIWSRNHALVLPSRYEGLPLALVEAMLCHRTAIVTDVGGNSEAIQDQETGFIAKAPSLDLMDDAIEEAWQRRTEWETMGKRAGQRIRELVPRDPIAHFCDILLELASQKAKRA